MRAFIFLGIGVGLIALQALVLHAFGQPAICECGHVKIWEGAVRSAGNSQHLSDWYSFSHVIHGIIFYFALTYLFPRIPLGVRFLLAMGIEIAWEIAENTPTVIEHYRQQALAQGYTGDSVLNSLSDTVMMLAGFVLAWKLRPAHVVALALVLELFTLSMIRDNLALNILNLIHGFPAIDAWQAGLM